MRFWIDAFLFRVSAMVPEDQSLVLNTKHGASATTITPSSIWSGYTDYTVVIADKKKAGPSFFRSDFPFAYSTARILS